MSEWANGYYRKRLSGVDAAVYDCVYNGWKRSASKIDLPAGVPEKFDINDTISFVAMDHPEIFWVNYYAYTTNSRSLANIVIRRWLEFNFFFGEDERELLTSQAYAWRERICKQIPVGIDQRDKLWMLYDYLSRQVTYGEKGNAQSHTIIGCFLPQNHVSVCEGIAKAFKFLCDGVGIPCIIVTGNYSNRNIAGTGGHAWNLVSTEGCFRHLDITSALDVAKSNGIAPREGYLFKDLDMHSRQYNWDTFITPRCY